MTTRFSSRSLPAARALLAAMALSLTVSACVVGPPGAYYEGGYVSIAPPPPRVEYYGVAPGPGYLWLGGYWRWTGRRYAWVGGHWGRYRPGYNWVPDRWARGPHGWRHERGHWSRR